MNQIKVSKDLDSERKRIFSSKLKLSNGCSSITPPPPPRVNLESFSLHRLHQMHSTVTANPNPDDLKDTRKLEASLNVENQEKQILHNILQSFTKSRLVEILQEAAIAHPTILHTVLSIVDDNPSHRKIFIRSLGPKTTPENLHNFFSNYGEVEEAKVIFDRTTGYSKGYGFVTFKNAESFLLALENPSKKIDGFVSFTSICVGPDHSSGKTGNTSISTDEMEKMRMKRKIRVENVPAEMSSETLLSFFEQYGEIEEGPWGFDMGTGKSRGFAYLLYKNEESAKAALAERVKFVDGFRLVCKMVLREREKSNRNPTDIVEPLPSPPRTLVLPVSYYYCVYYSRRLVPYNYYYQNEPVMGGSSGQLGPWTQGQSSSALRPAPRIAGAANSGASSPSGR
ncbi:UBP1-associated protein 2C-like [Coffea eugenioides]|uniref:UBP1-associated protein 2C-like n=1 Tax=Coffea eugenioides TaxID=49369 RepID=UPI000F60F694|nr:UBP1-associated protein 2C-like [Coffea eugenioides]